MKSILFSMITFGLTACGTSLVKVEPVKVQEAYIPVMQSCFDSAPVRPAQIAQKIDMEQWRDYRTDQKVATILMRLGHFEIYAKSLEDQIIACRGKQAIVMDVHSEVPKSDKK